ncbi:hypothetical protein JXR93_03085 [bacterium]|nr:hypothetical protein [bacterium]
MIFQIDEVLFELPFNYFPTFKTIFLYKKGDDIAISGDFNDWQKEKNQLLSEDIEVLGSDYMARVFYLYPGKYQYRYVDLKTGEFLKSYEEVDELKDENYFFTIDTKTKEVHYSSCSEADMMLLIEADSEAIFNVHGEPLDVDKIFSLSTVKEINISILEKDQLEDFDKKLGFFPKGTNYIEFIYESESLRLYFLEEALEYLDYIKELLNSIAEDID